MMREETADQYLAPSPVSPAEFWGFDHVSVYTTLSLLVSNGKKDLCAEVSRTH